jgi:glycosyltransferase involved in cell wall biosynthesis
VTEAAAKLSVIIITKNEATNIRACLESVAWADEIIVVDSGSTDDTVAICNELGAQVYAHDWPGFGPQKNRALSYATNDWVFSIDADERVTEASRKEIIATLQAPKHAAYRLPRLSSFCGRYMRHSGWYPDYVTRLFRRNAAKFSDSLVHEQLLVTGKTGTLIEPLMHDSFRNLEQLLAKLNQYSSAGAEMLHEKGKTASLKKAVAHAVWAFFRTYIFRAGFLDGREGFMVAVSTAEGTYYRYVKLMLLNRSIDGR